MAFYPVKKFSNIVFHLPIAGHAGTRVDGPIQILAVLSVTWMAVGKTAQHIIQNIVNV